MSEIDFYIGCICLAIAGVVVWIVWMICKRHEQVALARHEVAWRGKFLRIERRTEISQRDIDGPREIKTATIFCIDKRHHKMIGTVKVPWFLEQGTSIEVRDLGHGRHVVSKEEL